MKIRGIYKIQSKIKPECIYIGSSEHIYNRWSAHRRHMFYNKHKNTKMQNHYNKYGLDDFIFEVIEDCSLEEKLSREQYYIDTLNPWFNINLVAGNTTGRKFSEETLYKLRNPSAETRLKLSIASKNRKHIFPPRPDGYIYPLKGKKLPQSHVNKMIIGSHGKPIIQYDLDGNFIQEWHGAKTAAKALGIGDSGIRRCLQGRYEQSYGFIWKYKN